VHAQTDVFVVGGGPAGLAAAIAASAQGLKVTVADCGVPPINKPCGEGLMPDGLAALEALGVQLDLGDGHLLRGSRFIENEMEAAAQFPRAAGIGLRRKVLHRRMIERAESCGVKLLWRSPVRELDRRGVRAAGVLTRAKWIVGADGAQSLVRRWANLDCGSEVNQRFCVRQHFRIVPWSPEVEVYWRDGSQIYVTPVAPEEIGIVVIADKFPVNFAETIRACGALAARLKNAEPASAPRGAVTVMRRLPRVHRSNVVLLGDASGSVDAITGEGLRLAFLQSEALACALVRNDLTSYQDAHRRMARLPRAMARLLLLLARRPMLRRRVVRALAAESRLFTKLLGVHLGEVRPSWIAATGLTLGWRLLTT
jgi:flavin-dependent dehydrogenase